VVVVTKDEEERNPHPAMGVSTGELVRRFRDTLPPYQQKCLWHLAMPGAGRKAHQLNWALRPEALREITGLTGGYTEVVRTASDLGPATARIADELNKQYTLGYSSARPPDGSWRAIRVRARNQTYVARARRGYYAVPTVVRGRR